TGFVAYLERGSLNQNNSPTVSSLFVCLSFCLRMCGMDDVDLDEGGSGEEEKEEEFWIGEGVKMLPPPVAHSGGSAWGSRRGRCGCVACGAALILWDLCVILASILLLALVFSVVLLPAMLLLYVGFLCHSRVRNYSVYSLFSKGGTVH
uniref:Uncharacterized protein n=1 Tax=Sander lucioperca TaxID=283035 RepID=A0A8D0CNV6_SANLU